MAFALVRSTISPALGASITPTYGGTPTAGNLLLCSCGNQSGTTTPTVSDSNGNWTLLASVTGQTRGLFLFGLIAVASQPTVITVARSTDNMVGNIYEFSGLQQSGGALTIANVVAKLKGGPAGTTGTTATTNSGSQPSLTGMYGPESLIFSQLECIGGTITSPTFSDGTFTAGQAGPSGGIRLVDYYKLSSAPDATYNGSFSWTTSRAWLAITTELVIQRKGFFP